MSNHLIDVIDPKMLNELQYLLTDLISGDESVITRPEYRSLDSKSIQIALNFLLDNPMLDDSQKAYLATNSWRVNYRDEPPRPNNFITEKYIGRAAAHTYSRIKDVFEAFMDPSKPYRNLILYPHIGWGKASRLSAKVFTPEGYVTMKDILPGQEVCTPNGKTAKVSQIFDQKPDTLFRVVFSDGRSTVVHRHHLWKTAHSEYGKYTDASGREVCKPCWKVVETQDILAAMDKNPRVRWYVPLTEPAAHVARDHIISPYILGALLGDGHFGTSINLYGDDAEIFDRVSRELPEGIIMKVNEEPSVFYSGCIQPKKPYSRKSRFKLEIKRMGLNGTRSATKFIPDEYLYDSVENRIALLQGLMDTDGTASKDGYATFYTNSVRLRDDMQLLVRGLGGYSTWSSNEHRSTQEDPIQYAVQVSFPNRAFPIFSLARKQARMIECSLRAKAKQRRAVLHITSIEPCSVAEPSRCLLLDDEDHLYLTDDYIVTHNSYLATLINIYIAIHLSMMRNPYKFFGLNPASVLSQLLVSFSLKKSSELLLEPLIAILEQSPFFEKVHTRDGMVKKDQDFERQTKIDKIYWTTAVPTSAIQMSNGANFKLVSNVQNLLGLSVVSGTMTELSFFRDAGRTDEYIMRVFNDLKNRIDTRMKGNYFGRSILDSSPNSLDSPIDDYVVNHARKDPTNYIVEGSQWKWAPEEYDMSHTFKVFIGGKGQPPRILESCEEADVISPEKLIDVPYKLKQFFEDDLYKALKDRAGIPSGSADSLIYDYSKIERIFDTRLRSLYTHIEANTEAAPRGLIWNQVAPWFFRQKAGRTEFWYKPHLPRCLAVDQSISGDVSAIAVVHVERMMGSDEQMFVVDMVIPIAPMGKRINLDAIKFFIEDLRNLGNMSITHVSFDQFQSEASIQYLKSVGFECERLSVDLTTDPYFNLLSLIETNRLVSGRNIYIKNNLKSLKLVKIKTGDKLRYKVDHEDSRSVITTGNEDWNKSMIGFFAKDTTDAIAAACDLLRKYHPVAYDAWDPKYLENLVSGNAEHGEAEDRTKAFLSSIGARIVQ